MTHEAFMPASKDAELDQLRDLVRHIAAEDEPVRLEVLLEELRTMVGLPRVEPVAQPKQCYRDVPADARRSVRPPTCREIGR
jgi:hypothetical protein